MGIVYFTVLCGPPSLSRSRSHTLTRSRSHTSYGVNFGEFGRCRLTVRSNIVCQVIIIRKDNLRRKFQMHSVSICICSSISKYHSFSGLV